MVLSKMQMKRIESVLKLKTLIKSQKQIKKPFGADKEAEAGTTEVARNSGFLCVISDLSTLRNPVVPLLNSPKKFAAAGLLSFGPEEENASNCAAVGGGGGGGPPEEVVGGAATEEEGALGTDALKASPPLGFQAKPVVCHCFTYPNNSTKNSENAFTH